MTVLATLESGETIRARITLPAWTELAVGVGDRLWCAIKATQVRAVPAAL
nr:TOBE domain-containing protein [Acidipropionibacterium acidipropionici]